jgi:hypothetical protein
LNNGDRSIITFDLIARSVTDHLLLR